MSVDPDLIAKATMLHDTAIKAMDRSIAKMREIKAATRDKKLQGKCDQFIAEMERGKKAITEDFLLRIMPPEETKPN